MAPATGATRQAQQGQLDVGVGVEPEAWASGEAVGSAYTRDPTQFINEKGVSGLKAMGGYVFDEPLTNLQGLRGVRVWREMADSDPVVGSMLMLIKQQIRKIDVKPEAAQLPEGHPKAQAAQDALDFVKGMLEDMETPINDVKAEASTFLEFGFAPMEFTLKWRQGDDPLEDGSPVSKFNDGLLGIHKIALRAQDTIQRWEMDQKGNLKGLWQLPWTGGTTIFIPIEKIVLLRTTKIRGNPEGRSVLRNCYRPWTLKKTLERIEGVGIERDLADLPVVRLPHKLINAANSGDAKAMQVYNAYKKLVTSVRRDDKEGLVLPSDMRPADEGGGYVYDVQLLTSGSRRNFDINATITRYAQEMAMSVMTDFVLLGHGARGTQALADTKVDVFLDSIQGYMDMIADAFTELLKTIWRINDLDPEVMPRFAADNSKQVDPDRLAALLQQLGSAGMPIFPDPQTEAWVRDQVGLPEPSPEAVAMRQQQQQLQTMDQMGFDPATGMPKVQLQQQQQQGQLQFGDQKHQQGMQQRLERAQQGLQIGGMRHQAGLQQARDIQALHASGLPIGQDPSPFQPNRAPVSLAQRMQSRRPPLQPHQQQAPRPPMSLAQRMQGGMAPRPVQSQQPRSPVSLAQRMNAHSPASGQAPQQARWSGGSVAGRMQARGG